MTWVPSKKEALQHSLTNNVLKEYQILPLQTQIQNLGYSWEVEVAFYPLQYSSRRPQRVSGKWWLQLKCQQRTSLEKCVLGTLCLLVLHQVFYYQLSYPVFHSLPRSKGIVCSNMPKLSTLPLFLSSKYFYSHYILENNISYLLPLSPS